MAIVPTGADVVGDGVIRLGVDDKNLKSGFKKSFTKVDAFALASGVAIGGIFAKGIQAASSFESAFAGVKKTIDETTLGAGASFDTLEQKIRDLATTIPVTFEALSKIGEMAGQLGVTGEENIVRFIKAIAKLEVTTDLTGEAAAASFARIGNVLGIAGDQLGQFTEELGAVVVQLGNNFATTESQIVSMVNRMAGAGAIANITAADIAAIATAFSAVGVEAEIGGTAFQKIILDMNKAVIAGGEQLELYAKISRTTSKEFAKAFEEDAAIAFQRFVAGLKEEGKEASFALEDLGFKEARLTAVFLKAAGAADVMTDSLKTARQEMKDLTALNEEAEKRFETFESKMALFKAQVREVGSQIGVALIPVVLRLTDAMIPMIEVTGDFIEQNPGFIRAVGLSTAALLSYEAVIAGRGLAALTGRLGGSMGVLATSSGSAATGLRSLNAAGGLWVATAALGIERTFAIGKATLNAVQAWREAAAANEGLRDQVDGVIMAAEKYGVEIDKVALRSNDLIVVDKALADSVIAIGAAVKKVSAELIASDGAFQKPTILSSSSDMAINSLETLNNDLVTTKTSVADLGEQLGLTKTQIDSTLGDKTTIDELNAQLNTTDQTVQNISGHFESMGPSAATAAAQVGQSLTDIGQVEKSLFEFTREQGGKQFDPWDEAVVETGTLTDRTMLRIVDGISQVEAAAKRAASAVRNIGTPSDVQGQLGRGKSGGGDSGGGGGGFASGGFIRTGTSGFVGEAGIERIVATPGGVRVQSNQETARSNMGGGARINIENNFTIDASNADSATIQRLKFSLAKPVNDSMVEAFRRAGIQPEFG